jgi:hypothetical protein
MIHQRSSPVRQSWRSTSLLLVILSLGSLLSVAKAQTVAEAIEIEACGASMNDVDVDDDGKLNRAEFINLMTAISPFTPGCPDSGSIQDFLGNAPFSAVFEELACLCLIEEEGNNSTITPAGEEVPVEQCCTGKNKHLKVPGVYPPQYTTDVCTAILRTISDECTPSASPSTAPSLSPRPSASPSFRPTLVEILVQIVDAGDPDAGATTQSDGTDNNINTKGINDKEDLEDDDDDDGPVELVWIIVAILLGVILAFLLVILVGVVLPERHGLAQREKQRAASSAKMMEQSRNESETDYDNDNDNGDRYAPLKQKTGAFSSALDQVGRVPEADREQNTNVSSLSSPTGRSPGLTNLDRIGRVPEMEADREQNTNVSSLSSYGY